MGKKKPKGYSCSLVNKVKRDLMKDMTDTHTQKKSDVGKNGVAIAHRFCLGNAYTMRLSSKPRLCQD